MREAAIGRKFWWSLLATTIAVGVLSRVVHTGVRSIDKYLGDAVYAAMVYIILRLSSARSGTVALRAAVAMLVIELFQLTGFASQLARDGSIGARIIARLLGTHFSMSDLLAYAVGIGFTAVMEWQLAKRVGSSAGVRD